MTTSSAKQTLRLNVTTVRWPPILSCLASAASGQERPISDLHLRYHRRPKSAVSGQRHCLAEVQNTHRPVSRAFSPDEAKIRSFRSTRDLKAAGVTIILTTHYIEEAEAIADRVAVINKGEILLVEDKAALMRQMGQKQLHVELAAPLTQLPDALAHYPLELGADRRSLIYTYDTRGERTGIVTLLNDLREAGLQMTNLQTRQSSLEDIFVGLLREKA